MTEYFIGVLSGTSLDAIDVAIVDFANQTPNLVETLNYPIPTELKNRCLELTTHGTVTLNDLGKLDRHISLLFAEAINRLLEKSHLSPQDILAIGSHGQTLCHGPEQVPPFTLQIGDPNTIAEKTGITTIADFRRRDIAAGGQGAPLAPAFHHALFHSTHHDRAILNIGGISNLSILPKALDYPLKGFDTGPGNGLLDSWTQKHLQQSFDRNGEFARKGQVHPQLLHRLLADPYFQKAPPKSTGREYFSIKWLEQHLEPCAPEDVQRTLVELTVISITESLKPYAVETLFVCGGGAHNTFLMERLSENLPIQTTEALGVPPDWVEAMLFAWLAKQTLEGSPGNCPHVTGASHRAILGGIFQP